VGPLTLGIVGGEWLAFGLQVVAIVAAVGLLGVPRIDQSQETSKGCLQVLASSVLLIVIDLALHVAALGLVIDRVHRAWGPDGALLAAVAFPVTYLVGPLALALAAGDWLPFLSCGPSSASARSVSSRVNPVRRAELDAVTEVARWSGSSRNEQPCRFIVLHDRDPIGRIAELGLPQTRGLRTATAAVAVVVPDEAERELSRAFDDGRAAERMLIAANLLGLGGGISRLRPDVRQPIGDLLGLPIGRSVRTIVGLGHPTADALLPKSKPGTARLPREQVVLDGRWPRR
jgi:nitroreductase